MELNKRAGPLRDSSRFRNDSPAGMKLLLDELYEVRRRYPEITLF